MSLTFGRVPDALFAALQTDILRPKSLPLRIKGIAARGDCLLWSWQVPTLGSLAPAYNQKSVGSCVGHGWARGGGELLGSQALMRPTERWVAWPCAESIYGLSRVEVGGGQLGNEDGSLGSWAAKAVADWGLILYKRYDSYDLSDGYNVQRCKDWGYRGLPDDLEPVAKESPIKDVALVTSADEVADAICSGAPVPVASMQGFQMKRGQNGICEAEGQWPHQMCFIGYMVLKQGNEPVVTCVNSWGDYLSRDNERVTLASGETVVLPPGAFNVRMSVVNKMAKQRDTFAISDAVGFRTERPDWGTINWGLL